MPLLSFFLTEAKKDTKRPSFFECYSISKVDRTQAKFKEKYASINSKRKSTSDHVQPAAKKPNNSEKECVDGRYITRVERFFFLELKESSTEDIAMTVCSVIYALKYYDKVCEIFCNEEATKFSKR